MLSPPLDLDARDLGSLLSVSPVSDAGRDWLADNVGEDGFYMGAALMVDHRFGPDLLAGALADGLYVTFDGREPC